MNTISVLPDLCTGCQSCEMVCSLFHEGSCSPSLSRIQVKKWGEIAVWIAIVCQHCTNPPCITVCPTQSRKRLPETQAVITDIQWCVGCKSCIYACPYGAPVIHPILKKTMTCDLCGGKPLCVDVCTTGALSLSSEGKASSEKRKLFAQKVSQVLEGGR